MAFPFFGQGAFTSSPNDTPETIARKRAYIAAMMPRFGSAKYVGEGLGQLATGFMVGRQNKKLDAAEEAGRKSAAELFDRLISGAGSTSYSTSGGGSPSGTWTPAAPPPSPVDVATQGADVAKAGGLSFGLAPAESGMIGGGKEKLGFGSATMTPQEMLIAGAEARGLNPVDVATAISYETGGKFDPMIQGPTTQWGTHRGLIQFGEPQAQQHGVDFSSPEAAWRSQLDPTSGAVWSYLDGAGVKPGMGLPEIYSGINAGSVGRMGASDANNGGAPGTVADKVASMGPHREKAAQFLGGTWTPDPGYQEGTTTTVSTKGTGGGIPTNELLAALSNPWLDQSQRAILTGIYEQQMQASDPLRQLELRKAELELAQLENPTQQPPEEWTTRAFTLDSLGIDKNSPEGQHYMLTGKLPEAPKPGYRALSEEEAARLPKGADPNEYQVSPEGKIEKIGGGGVTVNNNSGSGMPPDEEALRNSLGKKEGEAWAGYMDAGTISAGTMQDMQLLDELITMAPQGPISGRLASAFPGINSAADAFNSVVKRVAPTLRAPGSGATSDIEYEGMLKSLPQLSSTPEANAAISGMMKAKARINVERGQIVSAYQNGEIGAAEARRRINELNSRSIMTPELEGLLKATGPAPTTSSSTPAPDGVEQEIWDAMTPEERALWD